MLVFTRLPFLQKGKLFELKQVLCESLKATENQNEPTAAGSNAPVFTQTQLHFGSAWRPKTHSAYVHEHWVFSVPQYNNCLLLLEKSHLQQGGIMKQWWSCSRSQPAKPTRPQLLWSYYLDGLKTNAVVIFPSYPNSAQSILMYTFHYSVCILSLLLLIFVHFYIHSNIHTNTA